MLLALLPQTPRRHHEGGQGCRRRNARTHTTCECGVHANRRACLSSSCPKTLTRQNSRRRGRTQECYKEDAAAMRELFARVRNPPTEQK